MSRCKCCDSVLEDTEIIWYPDLGKHEELCYHCRQEVRVDDSMEELIEHLPGNFYQYEE